MALLRYFAPRRWRGGGGASGVGLVLTSLAIVFAVLSFRCSPDIVAAASASATGDIAGATCSSAGDGCAAEFDRKCGALNPVAVVELKVTLGGYAAATFGENQDASAFRQGRPWSYSLPRYQPSASSNTHPN
jgi:hypothetical protein